MNVFENREGYEKPIKNVERLVVVEEKFGVRFVGLNAVYDNMSKWNQVPSASMAILGEVQATNGTSITKDIDIICTAYDADGKVIGTGKMTIIAKNFLVLYPIDFFFRLSEFTEPAKLLIYPAKRNY